MVNTVLSVLALVYPPKNLVVYLSDDASSQLTFYALTKAAEFAKTWAPFCKEFDIEPRSSLLFWQGLKVDEAAVDNRGVTVEVRCRLLAVGFCSYSKKPWNHSSKEKENIIVIPTLVYPSREKRPEHHHLNDEEDNNNLKRQTSAALEHLPALKSARTVYELAIEIVCLQIKSFRIWFELEFAWYGGEIYIAGDIGGFKGNVQEVIIAERMTGRLSTGGATAVHTAQLDAANRISFEEERKTTRMKIALVLMLRSPMKNSH
ncbi:hypothetical protein YC2023_065714 [Brassica napus]